MSRGLGNIQKRIMDILAKEHQGKETAASYICYQVFGCCDERGDIIREPVASNWQSFWRALRSLEEKGLLASRTKPTGFMYRSSFGSKTGGSSHSKLVMCLVHGSPVLNSTLIRGD